MGFYSQTSFIFESSLKSLNFRHFPFVLLSNCDVTSYFSVIFMSNLQLLKQRRRHHRVRCQTVFHECTFWIFSFLASFSDNCYKYAVVIYIHLKRISKGEIVILTRGIVKYEKINSFYKICVNSYSMCSSLFRKLRVSMHFKGKCIYQMSNFSGRC